MTQSDTGAAGSGSRALAFVRDHKKITAVVLLFCGLTAFRLVHGQAAPHFGGGLGDEAVYVELSNANFGTVRELGLYYGTLSAPSRFSLAPRVGGELREMLVDIGDRLESGQVVAVLDDEEYGLARDRAYLAVTLAEAQMAEATANLLLARNDMFRQENLSRKSVVAASELEAAENRLRQAEARLGVAESQLASARNQLADAELKLSYTRVTAAWPAAEAAGASSSSSSASSATSASASLSSPASPPSLSSPSYPAVPGSSYPSVQPQATGPASASEADGVPTAETIEEGLLASAASIGEAGREAFAAVQGESEEGDSSDGTSGSSGLALQAPSAGSPDSADTPSASSPTSSASSSTSSAFSPTPSASSSSSSPSTSSTSTSSPSTSSTPPPTYSVASSYPGPGSGTAPASGAAAPATGSEAHAGYRYVGARLADTGSQIAANTPILDIVSLDPLLVVVDVIEKDYPRITVGMEASVRAEAFPGETFSATVKRVAPVLNAASRQARVELEVPNPGLKLKPGMYAEAVFTFNRHEGVWSVAADVPYRKFDGYVIFIANPVTGKVEERRVELGIHEGDRVELLGSGPIEGPVVTMGQHLLKDGQAYRVPGAELPVPASGVSSPSGSNGQRGGIAS